MNKLSYILLIAVLSACNAKEDVKYPEMQTKVVFNKNSQEYKDFETYVRMKSLVPNESVFVCGTFDDENFYDTTHVQDTNSEQIIRNAAEFKASAYKLKVDTSPSHK